MKIGIFGGTFDPVHNEHYNICMSAKTEFGIDRVIVLPAGRPPHKDVAFLSADKGHRLNMTRLVFGGCKGVTVSSYEMEKKELSYTYNTLEHFKKEYPNDELFLIIGGDSFIDFTSWYRYRDIFSLCMLIVCRREGYNITSKKYDELSAVSGDKIKFCSYNGSGISSTAAKVYLEFGVDCSPYMSGEVIEYIRINNLYNDYAFYVEKLKHMLSPKRFTHTVGTVITALKLAARLKFDSHKTFLAAALHDCTKKLSNEQLQGMNFVLSTDVPEPVAHSVSGSFIARTVFKIKDKDILNSIRYHTTGRPEMSVLEKIIYVADCIEETRDYEGVENLRRVTEEDFEKGFLACMEFTIQQLKYKEREKVSDMTLKAYEYYTQNKKERSKNDI